MWQCSQAEVHLNLYNTQTILLLLSVVEALLFLQHDTEKKTKRHISRDHLNYFINSFVQTKLQHPLCFCIHSAGKVQLFCNLDVCVETLTMTVSN